MCCKGKCFYKLKQIEEKSPKTNNWAKPIIKYAFIIQEYYIRTIHKIRFQNIQIEYKQHKHTNYATTLQGRNKETSEIKERKSGKIRLKSNQ